MTMDPTTLNKPEAHYDLVRRMRASFFVPAPSSRASANAASPCWAAAPLARAPWTST